jgi:hypothetical protein
MAYSRRVARLFASVFSATLNSVFLRDAGSFHDLSGWWLVRRLPVNQGQTVSA